MTFFNFFNFSFFVFYFFVSLFSPTWNWGEATHVAAIRDRWNSRFVGKQWASPTTNSVFQNTLWYFSLIYFSWRFRTKDKQIKTQCQVRINNNHRLTSPMLTCEYGKGGDKVISMTLFSFEVRVLMNIQRIWEENLKSLIQIDCTVELFLHWTPDTSGRNSTALITRLLVLWCCSKKTFFFWQQLQRTVQFVLAPLLPGWRFHFQFIDALFSAPVYSWVHKPVNLVALRIFVSNNFYRSSKNLLQDLLYSKETIRICSFGRWIEIGRWIRFEEQERDLQNFFPIV